MSAELRKTGASLNVDGSPFILLGGELGNSSASSVADIDSIFPRLKAAGLNTILVPAYWDLIEPEEGEFDFALIDHAIRRAEQLDMHLVYLWFGAWKNSMSCYAPLWFKSDYKRFPRAQNESGRPLEIASAFSQEVLDADLKAFTKFMRHIAKTDSTHRVIMMQIENEVGMLESARDHSPVAEAAFNSEVPPQLIRHLIANESTLHPDLKKRWHDAGCRKSGTWSEVFGKGVETDEIFMAWHYASYIEKLAQVSRNIIPLMPLYVNAAMNSRGRKPGEYPSAGPLAHLKDIWHAGAPSIDMLAPDLYDKGFVDWTAQYALPDNILFIPEIRLSPDNGAQALFAIGERGAIGFSPFSIENISSPRLGMAYSIIEQLTPYIVAAREGSSHIRGVWFDADSPETVIIPDSGSDLRLTCRHFFTLPWDPRATDGSHWPEAGGIIIQLSDDEFIVAGTGIVVSFDLEGERSETGNLGEDGFLTAGSERSLSNSGKYSGKERIGLGHVTEVKINPSDGSMIPLRHLNGDETHQGRHARIGVDDFKILHIKLYRYR